jgi:hypothetical protein
MANEKNAEEAVRQVVQQYINGSRTGDLDLLKSIFHPKATMSGYIMGNLAIGTPDPFFEAVAHNPSPEASGAAYSAEISRIEVTGRVASATLVEKGFMGLDFTDYFHLIEENGQWRIIAKTFMQY